MNDGRELPPELVEQFTRGNGVIFIGAGLSVGAGLPTWGELLTPLVARLPGSPVADAAIDKAQYYQNAFGRGNLLDVVEELITNAQPPLTAPHRLLTALPVRYIFTTNYDRLIERSFEEAGRPLRRVIDDTRLSSINNSITTLIKIHGDFDAPRSIVISTDDYDSYLAGKPAISDFIKVQLQTQSVLFLGYSFNDENLRRILRQVTRESGPERRNMFSVQFDANELATEELRRRGVRTISLPATPTRTDSLTRWLAGFVEKVRAHSPSAQTDSDERHNVPEMSENLYGREHVAADVSRLLQSVAGSVRLVGPGGIGKSHIASYVGRRATRPTGQLFGGAPFDYVAWYSGRRERMWRPNQAAFEEDVGLGGLLDVIATVLGYPKIRQMNSTTLKLGAVQLLLSQHRTLLILDQFDELSGGVEDTFDVNQHPIRDWVERVPAPSKALVVSQLRADGSPTVTVPGLTSAGAKSFVAETGLVPRDRELSATNVAELVSLSNGNPQTLQLAFNGASSWSNHEDFLARLGKAIETKALEDDEQALPALTWSELSETARTLVWALSVASDGNDISRRALEAATALDAEDFREVLAETSRKGLLEIHLEAPPRGERIRASALAVTLTDEYIADQDRSDETIQRLYVFYKQLIQEAACRRDIDQAYWNSLVSPEMSRIDAEWPAIEAMFARQQLTRSHRTSLALLLVHYLDSRQLHGLRRQLSCEASEHLAAGDELLLAARFYVDALVWTELERGDLESAENFIKDGEKLFKKADQPVPGEIAALARSWSALIEMLRGRFDAARDLLASVDASGLDAWVLFRLGLVSGELALRCGDYARAIGELSKCERLAQSYGGEGGGYQTIPRIGLALLAQNSLALAEEQFNKLTGPSAIANGKLAGRYGLALVRAARGVAGAGEEVDSVRRRLLKVSGAHSFVNLSMAVLSSRLGNLH